MKKYPFSVSILLVTLVSYTIWNGLKLYGTIKYWSVLIDYKAAPGPLYLSFIAIGWILSGLFLFIMLVKKNSRSIFFLRYSIWIYAAWYWFDRFLFRNTLRSFWLPLIISILTLIALMFLLNHKKTRAYFKASNQ